VTLAEAAATPVRASDPVRDSRRLRPLPRVRGAPAAAVDAVVVLNRPLADRYRLLRLHAPEMAAAAPGQFTMVTVTRDPSRGPVLPRPMAIYDVDRPTGHADIVYSVGGEGTRLLAGFTAGQRLGVVGPLGRGFDLPEQGRLLLLGRGIGTCSLTLLARRAGESGLPVTVVVSGRHPGAVIGGDLLRQTTADVIDVDDVTGTSRPDALWRHLASALDASAPSLVATCGSARLERLALRLARRWAADVQVSVEAHMACGLGYCHGCSTGETGAETEAPLVCRDGPVFRLRPGDATHDRGTTFASDR
jgi:dihydroorotate dehydrogenase electron transfer subunit